MQTQSNGDSRTSSHCSAAFESLEPRLLLDGNVTASIVGSNLIVRGDAGDTAILIDQAGLAADQVRISSAAAGTTINGGAGPVVLDGLTHDIRAMMGRGADEVTLADILVPGSVTASGGSDGLTVVVDAGEITRNFTVRGGAGDDAVSLVNASSVGGQVRLTYGAGAAVTTIDAGALARNIAVRAAGGVFSLLNGSTVAGNVRINDTGGDTTTTVSASEIAGSFTLRCGAGADATSFLAAAAVRGRTTIANGAGGSALLVDASELARGLDVRSGAGLDAVTLSGGTIVTGNARINNGAGDSTGDVNGATVNGTLDIHNAAGMDQFMFRGDSQVLDRIRVSNGDGGSLSTLDSGWVGGNVDIRSRRGIDDTVLTGSVILSSSLTVDNGPGDGADGGSLTIDEATVARNVRVMWRDGASVVNIANALFNGRTDIQTGRDAAAAVTVDDSIFGAPATIRTGNEADTIDIETGGAADGDRTTFARSLQVRSGDGDDAITVGVAGEIGNSAIFNAAAIFDGGRGTDVLDITANGNTLARPFVDRAIETVL